MRLWLQPDDTHPGFNLQRIVANHDTDLKREHVRHFNRLYPRYRADLAALLAVIIWSVSAPLRKAALEPFDVLPFTARRFWDSPVTTWSCRRGDRGGVC
jgi:hypothetical protein